MREDFEMRYADKEDLENWLGCKDFFLHYKK